MAMEATCLRKARFARLQRQVRAFWECLSLSHIPEHHWRANLRCGDSDTTRRGLGGLDRAEAQASGSYAEEDLDGGYLP